MNGLIAGYPMIGIKVNVIDGSFHEVDSSEVAFKIAASQAIKKWFQRRTPPFFWNR